MSLVPHALPLFRRVQAACPALLLTANPMSLGFGDLKPVLALVLSRLSISSLVSFHPHAPHLTVSIVRVFHPRPSSLAPQGPHLPACRSAPHELLWAGPAYFPSRGAAGSAQAQSGLMWAPAAPWRPLSPLVLGRCVPFASELLHFSVLSMQKAALASQSSEIRQLVC